jgi:phenolic acid decarboxylase
MVTDGQEATLNNGKDFYLDVHELGAGNVTAKDVAGAHQKDLAVQGKYGVNFINYWVDEKDGRVVCLSQASDSADIIKTHKEAHGLIPAYVVKVKQGQ